MHTYLELLDEAAEFVDATGVSEATVTEDTDDTYGTYVTSRPGDAFGAVQTATYVRTADHAMLMGCTE